MYTLISIILPIFSQIAFGYALTKIGYYKDEWIDGLKQFVTYVTVPCLLFISIAQIEISHFFHMGMILSYYLSAIVSFLLCALLLGLLNVPRQDSTLIAFGGTFSNSVLMGVPLVTSVLGPEALSMHFALVSLHGPILLLILSVGMALTAPNIGGRPWRIMAWQIVREVAQNPLSYSLFLGVLWNIFGLPVPSWLNDWLRGIGILSGPVALFAIGASLTRYRMGQQFGLVALVALFKLLFFPLLVMFLAYKVFFVPDAFARVAVIMAALPAGITGYVMASYYNRGLALNASLILLTTVGSTVSLTLMMYLLEI